MESNLYYCYSSRQYHFLTSVKFRYVDIGINKNKNKKYWTYEKSEKLDSAIEFYNSIKHKFT